MYRRKVADLNIKSQQGTRYTTNWLLTKSFQKIYYEVSRYEQYRIIRKQLV